MKTIIVLAHPEYMNSNTQQFLIESTKNLQDVTIHILNEESIDIKQEKNLIKQHDRIIFQFPMYWYSAPSILKNWIDTVFDDSFIKYALKSKELGLVVTMGLSKEEFAAGRSEKFTLSEIFRPFEALANKCQMSYLPIFPVDLFSYKPEKEKMKLLIEYQIYLTKENQTGFKSREGWFINRLTQFSSANSENQEVISSIIDSLEENRDTLDDLLILVKEMRLDDE